ncbi:fungal-specific transcription factor domain-containing protein [Coniochaeta sp. 2T2.1]|nr:fungal-specific transcription factor domain-containing protein [Coniochaeta sp. 2T2.1]
MTAPPNPPAGTKDAASARKRRRRAPAGGAADDCFTCAKRNVKCDRKRPYCSQCLEIGNECSGYKTQLTWGVGVASRGKLRGLSLPIAKAPPVNPVKKSPTRTRADSISAPGQWDEQTEQTIKEDVDMNSEAPPSVPPTPFNPYEMSHISSPEHTPAVPHSPWSNMHFPSSLPENDGHRYQTSAPLHLSVPSTSAMMSSSMDSISEVDYMSPMAHSFPRDDNPFMNSPTMFEHFQPQSPPVTQTPVSAIMIEQPRPPTSCPSLVYGTSEHSSSLQSHMDNFDAQISHKFMHDNESLAGTPDLDTYSTSAQSQPFWASSIPEEGRVAHSLPEPSPPHWPLTFATHIAPQILPVSAELIAKMPFFMDYYENTMCPSMVFIDGPNNPFREHILQLAASSRSLQHAICALAACNLRMKRKLSLGQHGRELSEKRIDTGSDLMSDTQPEDQSQSEEYQHRNLAVHLLNEQLNDNDKSRHDSVLATILLLCHYRMAESGVAKFQTQFAGVKKILGLRRMSPFPPSRDSSWMEALFTYFDAISASINDREAQLSSFYGLMPESQPLPPGSENLVGCDRELFKTIIKLGRLNLLSQHRPVQNLMSPTLSRVMPSRSDSPLHSPLGHTYKPNRTPHAHQMSQDSHYFAPHTSRYDGNGFASSLNEEEMLTSAVLHSPAAYDDHRSTFWREWKDARLALQSWEFDSQRVVNGLLPGSSNGSSAVLSPGAGLHSPLGHGHHQSSGSGSAPSSMNVTSSQVRDLGSLSEAFRYAALLYTERLASPNVPSAHSNFRNLVSQVVYYATSLEAGSNAEKFLLWPLFVAGSECVNELQQNIVRSKCREIMARSGYMNNLAALDVLERLWAGDWKDESRNMGIMRRGPFNWAKCIGGPGVEEEGLG